MSDPTDHRITAAIGEGLKVDIVYRYTPDDRGCQMEVLSGIVLDPDGAFNDWTPAYVKSLAQDWLDDDGYEMACQHAEDQRHGNEE